MNSTKIKLTFLGICVLVLAPSASQAASATLLNDETVLFSIDFAFTDELFDVEVPIVAEYGVTYADRVNTLGYTLLNESGDTPTFSALNALVLSRQPIQNNRYYVPRGETGMFRLIILATFSETITEDQRAYITKVPYFLNERRTTVHQNQLDDLPHAILEVE